MLILLPLLQVLLIFHLQGFWDGLHTEVSVGGCPESVTSAHRDKQDPVWPASTLQALTAPEGHGSPAPPEIPCP